MTPIALYPTWVKRGIFIAAAIGAAGIYVGPIVLLVWIAELI